MIAPAARAVTAATPRSPVPAAPAATGVAFSSAVGAAAGVRLTAVDPLSWLTGRTTESAQKKADRMPGRILRLGPPLMPEFGGAESRGLPVHFAGWVSL